MTAFTYRDGIAIGKLVYYTFALVASIIVSWRHGFGKNSGWIYLAILSAVRIVNSSAQLSTLSGNPSSTTITIIVITEFLGISPLLLASLGLLSRIYYSILEMPWRVIFSFTVMKAIQIPAVVALILCIVGASGTNDPADIGKQGTVQAGIIIFLVVYIVLVFLTVGAAIIHRKTGRGEGKLIAAVLLSLPFLLVRIIYSMLSIFTHARVFSRTVPTTASTTAELFMAILEEMAVVLIYLWVGLSIQTVPRQLEGEEEGRGGQFFQRAGRGDFGQGRLGLFSMGAAVVDELRNSKKNAGQHSSRNHN